ncbi:MAG: hypothetical protein IJ830_02480 [Alphaproteobacteria bacterium]|nr:hypothetical protein [Alphaproteobacteria bacterium]
MEQKEYSETERLARNDTAIEIMAARMGMCNTRIMNEEDKPESERDEKLLKRLYKERSILAKERQRMYKGDEEIRNKIYDVYAKEVKDYYLGK